MTIEKNFSDVKKEIQKYIEESYPSVYNLQQKVNDLKLTRPERLVKPILKHNPTVEEAKSFAKDLEDYESTKVIYNQTLKSVNEFNSKLDDIVIDFIKDDSGLYDIPVQYQDGIWRFAWERGHSSSYSEVHSILCELVEIF